MLGLSGSKPSCQLTAHDCLQHLGSSLGSSLSFWQCAGLKATGLIGIWWQMLCLAMAVMPVWLGQLGARLPASTIAHLLLGGLVASRFGLWLFDLAVSQMLQEWVRDEDIGKPDQEQVTLLRLRSTLQREHPRMPACMVCINWIPKQVHMDSLCEVQFVNPVMCSACLWKPASCALQVSSMEYRAALRTCFRACRMWLGWSSGAPNSSRC